MRGLVYCYDCCSHPPTGKTFRSYGKMRPNLKASQAAYYRCRAREMGYSYRQKLAHAQFLDAQVLGVLRQLKPPRNWQATITRAVGELLGEHKLEERLAELHAIIRRMDMRWDNGLFVDEQEYLAQRLKLQQQVEQLTPVATDDLEQAAELLASFASRWDACRGELERQHELVRMIVERVYVHGEQVIAMTLKSNCHLVLGHKTNGPTESSVDPFLATSALERCQCGDDGI